MMKLSILMISLLTVMSGAAVSPAMANIIAAFPESSETLGKLILTLPALSIMPASLITGYLSRVFSRKCLLYAGLFLYVVGGSVGGLADDIYFLLSMRFILGIGVGVLMPLSTGIIAEEYFGEEKVVTMGYASAASNLGGIIATFLSGLFALYSWRASFSIYLLGVIVFVFIFLFIPERKPKAKVDVFRTSFKEMTVYILWGGGVFFVMVLFYTIPINISIYIVQHGLGNSALAGVAMSVLTVSSFITGLYFSRLKRRIGTWIPFGGVFSFGMSFVLMSYIPGHMSLFIAMAFTGVSTGILVPYIMDGVTSVEGAGSKTAGTSVVACFLFAGQFLSPILTEWGASLTTGQGIDEIFRMLAFGCGLTAIVLMLMNIFNKKTN